MHRPVTPRHLQCSFFACMILLTTAIPLPAGALEESTNRSDLISFQATHGLLLGLESCIAFDCQSLTSWGLAGLGGAATGAVLTWRLTPPDIAAGLVRSTNAGTIWGAALGGAPLLQFDREQLRPTVARMMGLQLVGTATGLALGLLLKPTVAQVSLVNSTGIWTGALVGLLAGALRWFPGDSIAWPALGGALAGIGGGVALAANVDVPLSTVRSMNLGGIAGLLAGLGFSLIMQGERLTNAGFFGFGFAGASVGLIVSILLARDDFSPSIRVQEIDSAPAKAVTQVSRCVERSALL